jgi:hypothetical protein
LHDALPEHVAERDPELVQAGPQRGSPLQQELLFKHLTPAGWKLYLELEELVNERELIGEAQRTPVVYAAVHAFENARGFWLLLVIALAIRRRRSAEESVFARPRAPCSFCGFPVPST